MVAQTRAARRRTVGARRSAGEETGDSVRIPVQGGKPWGAARDPSVFNVGEWALLGFFVCLAGLVVYLGSWDAHIHETLQ